MKIISTIFVVVFCMIQSISCNDILVQVEQGQLSGERVTTVTGDSDYYSFKGIPYAKPPTGTLRFKAPLPAEYWDGVRNATAHGNVCPQFNPITQVYTAGSEDCLFLNVYTPNLNPETLLPVIFYIHGGAFIFGSGDTDFHGPDFLVSKDVVVVTINYRLEALGFLCVDTEEVPGNAGLKDQVLALKWVKNNIENFGGCPNYVTIFGGSAGGASVAYHLVSPMSKGLFKRAISMSGVPSCDCIYPYQPKRRAFALGKLLGLDTQNTTELINFLQNVAVDRLINKRPYVLASENITDVLLKMETYTPVIETCFGDNNFITEDPFISLDCGNVNEADVMFSYNSQEAVILANLYNSSYIKLYNTYPELFVPSKILVASTPNKILSMADKIIKYYFGNKIVSVDNIVEFVNYASIASISYDVQRFYRRWPNVKNTYFFKFSSFSTRNYYGQQGAAYGIEAAAHLDDIFYIFDAKSLNMTLEENSIEYKMVQNIVLATTNFAKYGNPSPDSSLGVTWPKFDKSSLAYANFADKVTIGYAPDERDMQFWKSILEYAGMTF